MRHARFNRLFKIVFKYDNIGKKREILSICIQKYEQNLCLSIQKRIKYKRIGFSHNQDV